VARTVISTDQFTPNVQSGAATYSIGCLIKTKYLPNIGQIVYAKVLAPPECVFVKQWPMSSERDSFAKGIFSTFAKGFLLHKLLLKVNFSPFRVKKSRSHDMGHWLHPSLKHKNL
jgi:hypothetical protein